MLLSTKEFEALRHLARHPGKTMTANEIYENVWGSMYGNRTAVAVYIRRICRKIEDDSKDPQYIQTIHGFGDRFNPEMLKG